jgi:hypothetical protein
MDFEGTGIRQQRREGRSQAPMAGAAGERGEPWRWRGIGQSGDCHASAGNPSSACGTCCDFCGCVPGRGPLVLMNSPAPFFLWRCRQILMRWLSSAVQSPPRASGREGVHEPPTANREPRTVVVLSQCHARWRVRRHHGQVARRFGAGTSGTGRTGHPARRSRWPSGDFQWALGAWRNRLQRCSENCRALEERRSP